MKDYEEPGYWDMCEAAEEIQALRREVENWKLGDIFLKRSTPKNILLTRVEFNTNRKILQNAVWLPTQDDLQEMITDKGYFRFSLIENFYNFATPETCGLFRSMTQLRLAFVMHELYGKQWNRKKKVWEKEA